jgi:peptide-methionine (R)-S-oxide reductase
MRPFLNRRQFIGIVGSLAAVAAISRAGLAGFGGNENGKEYPVTMSDKEWKEKLSPEAYDVLRHQATERAFTSPLNDEHRHGTFYCAGCQNKLFSSEQKFNSGTGWPSFWAPVDGTAVETTTDYKIGVPRTEVHCAHCGGHLGHVFDDGPKPTGKRYCMNGVAMEFKAD